MKKIVTLVISIALIVSVIAGCSSQEIGFYQTAKSLGSLKNYSYSGNLKVKINKLEANPASDPGSADDTDSGQTLALIDSMLNNATVSYQGSVDSTNKKLGLNLSLASGDGSYTYGFHLILDDSNNGCLLDVSPELAQMLPPELDFKTVTINKIEYDQYNIPEIIKQIDAMQPSQPEMNNPYDEATQKAQYDAYTAGFDAGYADGYATMEDGSDSYSGDKDAYEDGYLQGLANAYSDTNTSFLKAMEPSLKELETAMDVTPDQQDFQNKIGSLEDQFMNTYFKNLSLGLIKKSGNSTYTCTATIGDLYNAFKKTLQYIEKNPEQLKTILSNFVKGLSDSQIQQLFPGGTKDDLLDAINDLSFDDVDSLLQEADSEIKTITDNVDLKVNLSLKKTASASYSVSDSVSFNNDKEADAAYFIDFSVSQNTVITGGGSSGIGSSVKSINLTTANKTLNLNVTDKNVKETGILLSTSSKMTSPTKIKAVKSGSTYVVKLGSLHSGTKYYYEVYTVDAAQNVLYSKQSTLVTPKAQVANPDTGR